MHALRGMSSRATRGALRSHNPLKVPAAGVALRVVPKMFDPSGDDDGTGNWPRKIFSGIQPTGQLHLGNYLGAVQKWTHLQNVRDDVTYCIVDMHSITLPQDPMTLRQNIFQMAATILACGIDPDHSTIFVQSAVREHAELCWILSCLVTMARLGHLPQYKEKSRMVKDVPLGLFIYPVLQAADILAYKTTHVPVGEDQVQHIQLAQHLAKTFNNKFSLTFPICKAIVDTADAKRIRSLRDPSKKMSKSDPDPKAIINVMDEPEVIVEKIKKAVTDFTSDVSYNTDARPGVSNLIAIHSLVTGKSIEKIIEEAKSIDTARYKMRVAEAVVEHLRPIRTKITNNLQHRSELIHLLEAGAEKARRVAQQTLAEVRQKVGLGAQHMPITMEAKEDAKPAEEATAEQKKPSKTDRPVVPKQQMRVEKKRGRNMEIKVDILKDSLLSKVDLLPIGSEALSAIGKTTAHLETMKAEAQLDGRSGAGGSSANADAEGSDSDTDTKEAKNEAKR